MLCMQVTSVSHLYMTCTFADMHKINCLFYHRDIVLSATCFFLTGSVFVLHLWLLGHFDLLQVDCHQCQFKECKCDIFVCICQENLGRLQGISLFANCLGNNNILTWKSIGRLKRINIAGSNCWLLDMVWPIYIIFGHHDQAWIWLGFCHGVFVFRPCLLSETHWKNDKFHRIMVCFDFITNIALNIAPKYNVRPNWQYIWPK